MRLGIIAICGGFIIRMVTCGGSISSAYPATRSHDPTYEVTTGEVSGLGTVLVDGKGLTLYLFLPDKHSSHSTCSDICAVAWPPLVLPKGRTAPLAGRGVKSSLLGTTIRSDGGLQPRSPTTAGRSIGGQMTRAPAKQLARVSTTISAVCGMSSALEASPSDPDMSDANKSIWTLQAFGWPAAESASSFRPENGG